KGYTYGIAAGMVSYPGSTLMVVSTEAANEYIEPVIKEVYAEMALLQNEKVPQEELEMVKNYMLGDLCRAYEGAFSIPDAWIFVQTAGLKEDFFEKSVESVKNITAGRIMELAQKYLLPEKMVEVVAGKMV
ncbi:MAG: insulinase family protein, partial [Phocaeicola sp.]|nr:insulinase family protein [Phocaeicola sp.]